VVIDGFVSVVVVIFVVIVLGVVIGLVVSVKVDFAVDAVVEVPQDISSRATIIKELKPNKTNLFLIVIPPLSFDIL
jgi:hypothetical protein